MDQGDLLRVLSDLRARNVRVSATKNYVQFSCLHSWGHEGGEDGNPSASASFDQQDTSGVRCFTGSCGYSGSLLRYVAEFSEQCENKYKEVVERVRKIEFRDADARVDSAVRKWDEAHYCAREEQEAKAEVWDEKELAGFDRVLKKSFLDSRKILVTIARDHAEVLWDPREDRVVVPIRRHDGFLVGCYGRCWCDRCKKGERHTGMHHNYWAFAKSKFLYGEFTIDRRRPVHVVEGCFDALRMMSAGFDNTVAVMGSSLSIDQVRRLKSLCQPVVLAFDGDKAGVVCAKKAIDLLKGQVVSLRVCRFPDGEDPKKMADDDLRKSVNSAVMV